MKMHRPGKFAAHPILNGKSMLRTSRLLALALALAGAALLMNPAHAQNSFTVGQRLSAEQVQALGPLQRVEIDRRGYQVLQTSGGDAAATLLLDARGRIGITHHEVMVAEQPTAQVGQALASLTAKAVSVRQYEHMNLTLLRYADLKQAIAALAPIRAALPGAQVSLPISFSQPKLH